MIRSFAVLAYLLACTGGSEVETPAPTDQAVAEPVAAEPETPSEGLVVGKTTLRKAATDEKKIDDGSGKMVSNYVTSLGRGEKVSVLGTDGDWTEVKVSDG